MKALLALAALALMAFAVIGLSRPVYGGEVVDWGGTGCRIDLTPEAAHVAEITCYNVLTGGPTHNTGALSLGGLQISAHATFGPGQSVDTFEAIAPDGFVVVPALIDIQEGASGSMLVFATAGMLLG